MRRYLAAFLAILMLGLSGCTQAPGIVDVTAPPLPTATTLPTAAPILVDRSELWPASVYNDMALELLAQTEGTAALCMPALANSLHSLYWAGQEESLSQLSGLLGIACTRENQCANADRLLSDIRAKVPDLDLWFRIYAGTGISLNESAMGIFPEYFDTSLLLADLSAPDWSMDLKEDMALATGGRLSGDLSPYAASAGQTLFLSCAAYDVRWQEAFDETRDKLDSFTASDGEKYSLNTMRSFSDHEIFRAKLGTLAVLGVESGLECWAILPREDLTVSDLLAQADMAEFTRWRSEARMQEMGVALPVLDAETITDYTPLLRRMGLTNLTGAAGQYETIGRGFSGADVVVQSSRLRFTHDRAPETPEPSPTPASQVITKPREPDMLTFNRESLFLFVDPASQTLVFAAAIRGV